MTPDPPDPPDRLDLPRTRPTVRSRRARWAGTLVVGALLLGVAPGPAATSAPRDDPRAERERVRAERAEVARQIDVGTASVAEVDDAIQALDEHLAAQEAALDAAEADLAEAERQVEEAVAAIERLEGEITVLRRTVRERAARAYVRPPGDEVLAVLDSNDFTSAAARRFYVELRATSDADVADRLGGALTDLGEAEAAAEEAQATATAERAEQVERTEAVRQARQDKQAVADDIEAMLQDNVERSVELAATDRALSAEILEQQAALQARLVQARAAEAAESADAAEAAEPPTSKPLQDGDGSEVNPVPPPPPDAPPPSGGAVDICLVGAIDVNCALAPKLRAMLDAAAADGIVMSGGGYRRPEEQIALRRQNCGTSHYAIYQMPSGSCTPETARPGSSQHELGMAVDISYQGSALCWRRATCRPGENRAYDWLVDHAATYGFSKLRSEAWHWSPSGR